MFFFVDARNDEREDGTMEEDSRDAHVSLTAEFCFIIMVKEFKGSAIICNIRHYLTNIYCSGKQ